MDLDLWPAAAALWGAAAGLLVPRAAYRFSVDPDQPWRDHCPDGHAISGIARGWLGLARCGACRGSGSLSRTSSAAPGDGGSVALGDGGSVALGDGGDVPVPDLAGDAGESAAGVVSGVAGGGSGGAVPGGVERGLSGDVGESAAGVMGAVVSGDSAGAVRGESVTAGAVRGEAGRLVKRRVSAWYGRSTLLVSLVTALVCAGIALATGTRPELAVWLVLAPLGVLLAVVDFSVQRLPDVLTLPLAGAALVLLGAVAAVPEHAGDWLTALLGALALGGAYFLLFLINPNGMGFGDVKLALGLGAVLGWYGWSVVFLGTFAGFLFGGLYGMGLVVARRAGRKTSIPFGPFLIAGAYVGLLMGGYAA